MSNQRVVLVTGAASGIGAATARAFAACGDRLVLADIARERLEAVRDGLPAEPDDVLAMATDTTDVDSVGALVAAGVERFGGFDVVHANAGICPPERPLVDTTPEVVDRILSVNVVGTVNTLRAAVPHVRDAGAVIITASVSGLQAHAGAAVYAGSKIALIGIGRALAVELAPRRIRVNMVCPGGVDTPLTRGVYGEEADDVIDGYRRDNLMGRIAEPEDIAAAVVYLAQANHVTGVSLRVDGGDCLMGAI